MGVTQQSTQAFGRSGVSCSIEASGVRRARHLITLRRDMVCCLSAVGRGSELL